MIPPIVLSRSWSVKESGRVLQAAEGHGRGVFGHAGGSPPIGRASAELPRWLRIPDRVDV